MEIALPEIEARKAREHQPVAFERRFVETVERFQLRDLLRVDTRVRAQPEWRVPLSLPFTQLIHRLLDRSTRHELDHGERDGQDAEQRRDHQQHTFENVAPHGRPP
ncbi:LPS assembly protein LptD [Trinickia sp. YCB016]